MMPQLQKGREAGSDLDPKRSSFLPQACVGQSWDVTREWEGKGPVVGDLILQILTIAQAAEG